MAHVPKGLSALHAGSVSGFGALELQAGILRQRDLSLVGIDKYTTSSTIDGLHRTLV
jgi:hypothetical protein